MPLSERNAFDQLLDRAGLGDGGTELYMAARHTQSITNGFDFAASGSRSFISPALENLISR